MGLSYLDENVTKWYTLSLNEEERPYDWKGLKVMLQEKFGGMTCRGLLRDYGK